MVSKKRTVFILLLGASVGIIPFMLSGAGRPSHIGDPYVHINDNDRSNVQYEEQRQRVLSRRLPLSADGNDDIDYSNNRPNAASFQKLTRGRNQEKIWRDKEQDRSKRLQQSAQKVASKIIQEGVEESNYRDVVSREQSEIQTNVLPSSEDNFDEGRQNMKATSPPKPNLVTRTNLKKRWEELHTSSPMPKSVTRTNLRKEWKEMHNDKEEEYEPGEQIGESDISVGDVSNEEEIDEFFEKFADNSKNGQRKILLDCGANMASTVELFRETYPGAKDFIIHSFEIDSRLAPYFNPFPNHHLHCPVGVAAKNGSMTAFTEAAWSPERGRNNGVDMIWGGGTLHASSAEVKNTETGGSRLLNVRPTIPIIDLSSWIQNHTRKDDYVIFKLDVEGSEYDILRKMLADGTFDWIDKFYGEFHHRQPVAGWTLEEKEYLATFELRGHGQHMIGWAGEKRHYEDFDNMHPVTVPIKAPGIPGGVYQNCGQDYQIALALAVGMNAKRARKVINTIAAYHQRLPVMLFIYGDYAELFPDDVKGWKSSFHIGVREDSPFPDDHFAKLPSSWVRESLVSAELRLQEVNVQPEYYLPASATRAVVTEARKRGFRLVQPTYEFPPKAGMTLENGNYYKYRDVERIPKALRLIYNSLIWQSQGGFLVLDTDLPDTRMNMVFLLDYLVENSGYKLVSVADCVEGAAEMIRTSRFNENTGDEFDGREAMEEATAEDLKRWEELEDTRAREYHGRGENIRESPQVV